MSPHRVHFVLFFGGEKNPPLCDRILFCFVCFSRVDHLFDTAMHWLEHTVYETKGTTANQQWLIVPDWLGIGLRLGLAMVASYTVTAIVSNTTLLKYKTRLD